MAVETLKFPQTETIGEKIITADKIKNRISKIFKGVKNLKENNNEVIDEITIKTRPFDDDWSIDARAFKGAEPIATFERTTKGITKETRYALRNKLPDGQYVKVQLYEVGQGDNLPQHIAIDYKDLKDVSVDKLDASIQKEISSILKLN